MDKDKRKCVGIVVDNAGYELTCDLLLGYILIEVRVYTHMMIKSVTSFHNLYIID